MVEWLAIASTGLAVFSDDGGEDWFRELFERGVFTKNASLFVDEVLRRGMTPQELRAWLLNWMRASSSLEDLQQRLSVSLSFLTAIPGCDQVDPRFYGREDQNTYTGITFSFADLPNFGGQRPYFVSSLQEARMTAFSKLHKDESVFYDLHGLDDMFPGKDILGTQFPAVSWDEERLLIAMSGPRRLDRTKRHDWEVEILEREWLTPYGTTSSLTKGD